MFKQKLRPFFINHVKLHGKQKKHYVSSKSFEWPSDKVRQTFIDYFCSENNHKFIKSSSVLPKKGSGTYFTNAGMNQFKSIILGEVEPADIIDTQKYIGIANSQKCIRIGGKHNDLEDIGKDTYHHTFFEMLGNWSFGSYSNEKACQLALDLLVNRYKLNINGLYFTYFGGDKSLGLEPDYKSKKIWLQLGVPERQILAFDMKSNFWEMDVVGPCGPCTEIHYDRMIDKLIRPEQFTEARALVNAGQERVIELWNLVFMNYNRTGPKNFSKLPFQVIDTGMGLERLTTVLNNLDSNYDTDLFLPLFEHIFNRADKIKHYSQLDTNDPLACSYRTLSDYMRSITISINDGLLPSRNGLGGFLKFLILKSIKISKECFKIEKESDFLAELVPIVVESLKKAYPELENRTEYIQSVIRETHSKQKEKTQTSTQITERYLKKLHHPSSLSGEQIWKLFKGDGSGDEISIDFIQDYCKKKNIQLDIDSFEKILLNDNEKSLKNLKNVRSDNSLFIDLTNKMNNVAKTDNSFIYEYDLENNSKVAIFKQGIFNAKIAALAVKISNGKYEISDQIKENDECLIVLDRTIFYPESGGQKSDTGFLSSSSGAKFEINNVKHVKGYTFHMGKVINSHFKLNDQVSCEINAEERFNTTLNHTAVHLINHSIRQLYNNENAILQTSSMVRNDSFKFEFKFNQILSKPKVNDIEKLEKICNELIKKSIPIYIINKLDKDNFNFPVRKLNDVLYPREVRLVSIGSDFINENKSNEDYSAELCCGSHAKNTSQLEKLFITNFNVVGDSSYEIEGRTAQYADQIEENNKKVLALLNEMAELENFRKENESKMSSAEIYSCWNQIAEKSIQIEAIFKQSQTSYLTLHKVKEEAAKYRPSKNFLQNILKNYFIDELGENSHKSLESILIASMDPSKKMSFKFMAFDSILNNDQILSVLHKMNDKLHPYLILYNKFRNFYIFYSRLPFKTNPDVEEFFAKEQDKILKKNTDASLVQKGNNHLIIKCNLIKKNKFKYFSF